MVAAPKWGVAIRPGTPKRIFSLAGSTAKTSRAAPATCPFSSAVFKSVSIMSPPRAQFIILTPFFIFIIESAFTKPLVESVNGVWRVIKSDSLNSVSSSTLRTPSSIALSSDKYGSNAKTRILRPCALSATIEPILPQPTIPKFFPVSSVPIKLDFSHFPAWVDLSAVVISRARLQIIEIACSAVVTAFPKGVFITTTPAADAASTAMLSTPIPARPTTFKFFALAITSAVTFVAERIASPS